MTAIIAANLATSRRKEWLAVLPFGPAAEHHSPVRLAAHISSGRYAGRCRQVVVRLVDLTAVSCHRQLASNYK